MNRSTPGLPVHHQLPEFTKLMSIESVMLSSHLILCHPLLLLPPITPSIRIFSNEYSGLIPLRMDWSDLLVVQGTLKSLLQHHSSKASILRCSAFFIVQLSHLYMTTGKTIGARHSCLIRPLCHSQSNPISAASFPVSLQDEGWAL